jgi:hypothetical protein
VDEKSIIRLAQEAGIYYREIEDEFCEADKDGVPIKMMAEFAALVAAAEREACAKLCEQMAWDCDDIRRAALEVAAERIRARGNATALPTEED